MKNLLLCFGIICFCSGCGLSRFAIEAAISPTAAVADVGGRVIWAGMAASAPYQQSDWAEQNP